LRGFLGVAPKIFPYEPYGLECLLVAALPKLGVIREPLKFGSVTAPKLLGERDLVRDLADGDRFHTVEDLRA